MKKISAVACLAMMLVMMMSGFAFADDFHITSTYPVDGAKNTTKENMCVKVYFNTAVGNAKSKKINANKFSIRDKKTNRKYPTLIYYNKKNPKYVLFLVDTTKVPTKGKKAIKDNTEYVLEIDEDFVNNEGQTLGNDKNRIVNFRTLNQQRNTSIYMIMMFLMFGGMFLFAGLQSKKEKEKDQKAESEVFNPYREAKKTGKTVAEVLEEHNKEEEKRKERQRRKQEKEEEVDKLVKEMDERRYPVKRPRPIREAGSTYKTGRHAEYEEEQARLEQEKAERKANGYQKKERKPQQQNNNRNRNRNKKKKKKK